MNIHRVVAKHVTDLIFSATSIIMAHHYAGGTPTEQLTKTAETFDELGEEIERYSGEVDFEVDLEEELTDTDELEHEAKATIEALELAKLDNSNEYFAVLHNYVTLDGTPEQVARESELPRSEFFGLSTELQEEGYLELDNGQYELTAQGLYAFEGLDFL